MRLCNSLALLVSFLAKFFAAGSYIFESEQRLYNDLFSEYQPDTIPIDSNQPVIVNLQLYFIQLVSLDQVDQFITASVWLVQNWEDKRLVWDPNDYNNITTLRVNPVNIWIPDITLYNSADGKFQYAEELESQVKVRVFSDGTIRWTPLIVYTATCRMHLRYFPFDAQLCNLRFGSWVHDRSRLDIKLSYNTSNLDEFINNHVWYIVENPARKNLKTYSSDTTVEYVDVQFFFILIRNYEKYIMNILLPCIVFGILCAMAFYVPCDSGERLTLSLSILIAISVYQVLVADLMPKSTDQTPILSIFLTSLIFLVVISVIMTIIILRIYNTKFMTSPPKIFVRIYKMNISRYLIPDDHGLYERLKKLEEEMHGYDKILDKNIFTIVSTLDPLHRFKLKYGQNQNISKSGRSHLYQKDDSITSISENEANLTDSSSKQLVEDKNRSNVRNRQKSSLNLFPILQRKNALTEKEGLKMYNEQAKLKKQLIDVQWKLTAMFLDRICMIIYSCVLLIVTVWCLSYASTRDHQVRSFREEVKSPLDGATIEYP